MPVTMPQQEWSNATATLANSPVIAYQASQAFQVSLPNTQVTMPQYWENVEERSAYMEATVEQDIAWQIKINRERRGLSQADLGGMIETKQSAISRLEDPSYGSHSIPMLVKIANAFDCALLVKLIPFTRLAQESKDVTEDALYVQGYDEEKLKMSRIV